MSFDNLKSEIGNHKTELYKLYEVVLPNHVHMVLKNVITAIRRYSEKYTHYTKTPCDLLHIYFSNNFKTFGQLYR